MKLQNAPSSRSSNPPRISHHRAPLPCASTPWPHHQTSIIILYKKPEKIIEVGLSCKSRQDGRQQQAWHFLLILMQLCHESQSGTRANLQNCFLWLLFAYLRGSPGAQRRLKPHTINFFRTNIFPIFLCLIKQTHHKKCNLPRKKKTRKTFELYTKYKMSLKEYMLKNFLNLQDFYIFAAKIFNCNSLTKISQYLIYKRAPLQPHPLQPLPSNLLTLANTLACLFSYRQRVTYILFCQPLIPNCSKAALGQYHLEDTHRPEKCTTHLFEGAVPPYFRNDPLDYRNQGAKLRQRLLPDARVKSQKIE